MEKQQLIFKTPPKIELTNLDNLFFQLSSKACNLRCKHCHIEKNPYKNEEDFYLPYFTAAFNSGIGICVGDGCPDLKLHLGIQAIKSLKEKNPDKLNDVAFFIVSSFFQVLVTASYVFCGAVRV